MPHQARHDPPQPPTQPRNQPMSTSPRKVIFDTDPGVDDAMALYYALAERGHGTDAILDLREVAVMFDVGQRTLCEQIELVGAEHPTVAALGECLRLPALDGGENAPGVFGAHRLAVGQMRELRHPNRHERDTENRVAEVPEIGERSLEDVAVVEIRHDDHLAVELDAALGQARGG